MSTPLPPDPYKALGVEKTATAAQIKTIYRKLALKCHPDKVTDESKKTEAADQFHRIQQAYEILSDEARRQRYDAQFKLVELKKQAMNDRLMSDTKTAAYDMATSTPGRGASAARGTAERVYEERKPDRSDSDRDYFSSRTAPRKHDGYERPAKKATTTTSSRDDRDQSRAHERVQKEGERVLRRDKGRTRDKETRRDRETKYSYADNDSEVDDAYEARRRRERESERKRDDDLERERTRTTRDKERDRDRDRDERERERDKATRRGGGGGGGGGYEKTTRRYSQQLDEAAAYLATNKSSASSSRPSVARTASVRADTYIDRSAERERRPAIVMRRHSNKPASATPQPSSRRERQTSVPDIYESVEERERRPAAPRPPPPSIARERSMPVRSTSLQADESSLRDMPPTVRRSDTMPSINTSPRRPKDSRPSNLRATEFSDGLPTPSASPDSYDYQATPSYNTKTYRYPVVVDDDDYRRTDRERERRLQRSPSPPPRRPTATTTQSSRQPPPLRTTGYTYAPTSESPQTYSARPSPVRRDTRDPLYGEIPKVSKYSSYDDERPRSTRSPIIDANVDAFAKAPKMAPEDVRMASGYSTSRRAPSAAAGHHQPRPSHLSRHHTSGYAQVH